LSYKVIWLDDAATSLQRIYDAELDKEGLAQVVVRIGLELSANPAAAGESRDAGARILFKHPLVVWFQFRERMKIVWVYQVRRSRLKH